MGQEIALYVNAKQELSMVGSCVDDFPEFRNSQRYLAVIITDVLGFVIYRYVIKAFC